MSQLDDLLSDLVAHPGVDDLFLLGRDGLLIRHLGSAGRGPAETVAAMVPGVATACAALADAAGRGDFATAALEWERGVAVVSAVSPELLLALFLRPGSGFAPLLRDLRRQRPALAQLL